MLERVLAKLVHCCLTIHHADVGVDREAGRLAATPETRARLVTPGCVVSRDGVMNVARSRCAVTGRVLLTEAEPSGVAAIGEALLEGDLALSRRRSRRCRA